jgi:hypothetical protein
MIEDEVNGVAWLGTYLFGRYGNRSFLHQITTGFYKKPTVIPFLLKGRISNADNH